ncbi:MAG: amidohydrolase [Flavobacteriales bacterium]|nr:amidohydrolase [Flavobacteriales bacterium]MDG1719546.1 amidohydrolase [Flavobacteriales bacterium]
MNNNLNITLVQSNIFWKGKEKNFSHLNDLLEKIQKTDIILLPEMFNTGFCPADTSLSESMNGKTVNWMKELSKQNNCSVAGTLMIVENHKVFNRLVWVSVSGETLTYDKYHLFSLINEQRYISKGQERLIIDEQGWKICPLICYDLRFPVFCRNNVDYDILIYLANWPVKRIDAWGSLLKARSIENQCYTIGVNRVGEDGNGALFNGHSKVFDSFGKEIISATDNTEAVLQISLSLDDLKLKRRQMNFLQDRDDFTLQ